MFNAPRIACSRSSGNRQIIPVSCCSSPLVTLPGAIDGTLKTSSMGSGLISAAVSKSPAEDNDDDDDDEEEEDEDRLSFRIEVRRVEVLRLS